MTERHTVAVIGAGGKMGMRISDNLQRSDHDVRYTETAPAARERVLAAGRSLSGPGAAVDGAGVVILAVPDVALAAVSAEIVPLLRPGAVLLTLDPAAAYAGVLHRRDDIAYAVAHPCHPSVFLHRTTAEEHADSFGGIAAPQEVVAAFEPGAADERRAVTEEIIRVMYGPVLDVHWVTVKQLAVLEPTLVETVACMVGDLLREALHETVHTVGVPEAAARAMLHGHIQVALSNTLRGANPFSDGCRIAMDYGRESIVRPDWKRIFEDAELDRVIARMLRLETIDV
ncbi:phosphogluconate dehydrogenase C-terminal domain-containing protein [Dactylosporangium sp. AC04546]|uniref:phosphogluconate dehydrogenase C-terminal domain-containing protein n=1 Tax=Dactylosporangium sp. AC04546 TaxID=2862460 RepID=UPI001EE0E79F|nr:phosphogluconate dehydrogenase C-terminal domain-containing protein [Dactylosporangium sp. AC04546]WVK87179.1 phosphogluconate dehydrogenase C-terminal domain-containing protein [Dactylosporangium sp. AC04546]